MIGKSFKGNLSEVTLPDFLEFLKLSRRTGVSRFKQDGVQKSIYIKEGNVTFATSNLPQERLGDLLLSWGKISRHDYNQSVSLLRHSTKRQGRILVELGALTPKQLWDGVQGQVRYIVNTLFNWDQGMFFFKQGDLPSRENITTDVGITELIMEGIRQINNMKAILSRFPSGDVIVSKIDQRSGEDVVRLEHFEKYVLNLVDGVSSIEEICLRSEIGETETIKVLYMLISIGFIKVYGTKCGSRHETEATQISSEEAHNMLGNYNRMFSYLYRYMLREVGPITEHVWNKHLFDLREGNPSLLMDVDLRKDGTLDESAIRNNLRLIRSGDPTAALLSALNEFLYSLILAVKRTLGTDHESRVIEMIRESRPEL